MGDQSDEGLMLAAVSGQREAMNALLRRYANSLLTFILRMTGNQHRAEELFQEVFLAVWAYRRRYRYPRVFRSWLFGIAVNKCRAEFRRHARTPASLDDCPDNCPASTDPPPIDALTATETAELVAAALGRLSPGQREVVVLRIWQERSYPEIAETLDCAESTVRSQMFHGLAALRRYLEPRLR